MTLLAPAALVGLLLLAIPIIVHLFKPRKMKATPFSTLRWLRQTHQRLSRRIQWHQWLLFLCRAGVLVFLVVALARPVIGLGVQTGGQVDRVLVLDVSRSMSYKTPALASPWETARELAGKYLQDPRSNERTAVLLTDTRTRVLSPLVPDASATIAQLNDIEAGASDTNLASALPVIAGLLQDSKRSVELVVVTDQQTPSWQQGDIQTFVKKIKQPLKVRVVDVGFGTPSNAWIAGARLVQDGSGQRLLVVEAGCVGEQQERKVRLTGVTGLAEDAQQLPLEAGKVSRLAFRLPSDLPLTEQIAEIRLEPADNLPSDDVWYLPLDASDKTRVLVIEPENTGSDGRPIGLFLKVALESLGGGNKGGIDLQVRKPGAAGTGDVARADVVFLAGAVELPDPIVSSLEAQVRAGMGLVVFVGPTMSAEFYNEKLHRPLQPAEGLVPQPLADESFFQRKIPAASMTQFRWQHPILAPLNDPVLGDLVLGNFEGYVRFKGEPGRGDQVLSRFDDGTPALVEHPLGIGRVLLCNTSANTEWSDLPRRQTFVPFLDRTLAYLARGGANRARTVGDAINLTLAGWGSGPIDIVAPSGKKLQPRVQKTGDPTIVHLDDLGEGGIYRVEQEGSDRTMRLAVNVGRGDSRLAAMDNKVFTEWWDPVPVEVLSGDDAGRRFDAESASWPLWPLLIALVGILLIVETVYAAWLCPRRNPVVAESVVHQRGLMRSVATKEA